MQIAMNRNRPLPQLGPGISVDRLGGVPYSEKHLPTNTLAMNQLYGRTPSTSTNVFQDSHRGVEQNFNSNTNPFGNNSRFTNSSNNPSGPYNAQYAVTDFSNQSKNFNNKPVVKLSKSETFSNNKAHPSNNYYTNVPPLVPPVQNDIFPRLNSTANYTKTTKSIGNTQIENTPSTISTTDIGRNAVSKKNENEKVRIFTGTAERVIKWHKVYNDNFCLYEIIASMISIQEGTVRLQKILLLRDRKGPIMQVVHYDRDHINIENFCVGQMLRCVGRMVGPTTMHGLSIREASPDEVATLQRMCYISDHAITKALAKS